MANLRVSGGVSVTMLVNGDSLNTVLNATQPLYQTFKKGTDEFNPNWATMDNSKRPIVYPRVYSVVESREIKPQDITWKYNNIPMTFNSSGVATAPDLAAGKIRQIDYNGSKALRIEGNVASDTNNDSDTITFLGTVQASGQTVSVSTEITLLVEEASSNLYRLFLNMTDDVIDNDETELTMTAVLYHSGVPVTSGVKYEFLDISGSLLPNGAKGTRSEFTIHRDNIDSELMVVCKAYINDVFVAQEQRQVWDSLDPYTILCDRGSLVQQDSKTNLKYTFTLLNARTGATVPNQVFTINVYKSANNANISSQFTRADDNVIITGAKLLEHKSLYIDAQTTVNK